MGDGVHHYTLDGSVFLFVQSLQTIDTLMSLLNPLIGKSMSNGMIVYAQYK